MAERETTGWLGGWLEAAKTQALSSIEMVKNDFAEFSSTMQKDTVQAATDVKRKMNQENVHAATQKAKAGVNQLLEGITKAWTVEPGETKSQKRPAAQNVIYDRAQARLHTIQIDPSTYLADPVGQDEEYNLWSEKFNLENHKPVISDLLVTKVEVRSLFTQLVPSQVSNHDFWRRYFFKLHQLEKDDQRRAALMKRAELAQNEVSWDEEDDWEDIEGPSLSPPVSPKGPHDDEPIATQDSPVATEMPSQPESRLPAVDELKPVSASQEKSASCATKVFSKPADSSRPAAQETPAPSISPTPAASTSKDNSTKSEASDDKDHKSVKSAEDSTAPRLETKQPAVDQIKKDIDSVKTSEADTKAAAAVRDLNKPLQVAMDDPLSANISQSTHVDFSKKPDLHVDVGAMDRSSAKEEVANLKVKEKGEMVVVGSDNSSNSVSPSSGSSTEKEADTDDWEKEFDVEITEDDLKLADEVMKRGTVASATTKDDLEGDDDWEEWD